jgi:hypothetical protein
MKAKKIISLLSLSLLGLYSCTPNGILSNNAASSGTSTIGTTELTTAIKTKSDLVNAYRCAIDSNENSSVKSQLEIGLNTVSAIPEASFSSVAIGVHAKVLSAYNLSNCNLATGTIVGTTNNPTPSTSPTTSTGTVNNIIGNIKTKAELLNVYNCLIGSLPDGTQKATLQASLIVINALSDVYFTSAVISQYESVLKDYDLSKCSLNSNIPATTVTDKPLFSNSSYSMYGCDAEKILKSKSGKSINIKFINNMTKPVKIYWINSTGKRIVYNANLSIGSTHPQQTYVTHPWVIADSKDNCLGVYLFNENSDLVLKDSMLETNTNSTTTDNNDSSSITNSGTISSSVTVGTGSLLSAANNLARLSGTVVNVSSEYSLTWNKERLIDGDLATSWFTKVGDAANKGSKPYIELVFPKPVNIKGVNLKGNREYKDGYDIFEGNLIVNTTSGNSNYNVKFAEPNRDFDILFNQNINNVTSVKLEITKDESVDPGLAEFEVVAAN